MITIAGLPALPTRRNLLHKNLLSSKNQQIINLENNPENVKLYTGLTTAGAEQLDLKNFINKLEFAETTTPGNLIGGKIINLNANKKYYRIPFFTFRNLLKSLVTLYGVDAESDFLILGTHCYIQSFKTGELIDPKAFSNNPEYKIIVDNGLGLGKENNAIIENKVTEIDIFNIPIALSTFRYWFNKNKASFYSRNHSRGNLSLFKLETNFTSQVF